jgi:hypothetical protein
MFLSVILRDVVLQGAFAILRKATVSFVIYGCLLVCPCAWNSWAPTGRIYVKFDTSIFSPRKSVEKIEVH